MLKILDFNLILSSPYDFIRAYFFDFMHNQEDTIKTLKMKPFINRLEKTSVYIAKMMLHSETFWQYR